MNALGRCPSWQWASLAPAGSIGRLIGADAVQDEITAQARAAVHWSPDVDTVFEIGGRTPVYLLRADRWPTFR